ncbi:MAG: 2-hydroxychromene-2-carboxylate isomerase [Pseudomonadota bacterium]
MPQITYYFSVISPFTYLAGNGLEDIAQRHGAAIDYRPIDIIAAFARTGGVPPGQRHPNRQAYRLQELRRSAKKAGVPMNMQPAHFPTNAAPASYAVIAAQKAGGGDLPGLIQGFLRAVWAEDKNIAEDEVIRALLSETGFDSGLADSGMLSGAETYEANLEAAVEAGVFGAPFYITDTDERFWGHDRLDDLDAHISGKL